MSGEGGSAPVSAFGASVAARWLPRCLAGVVLAGALVTSGDLAPVVAKLGLPLLAPALAVLGGALALWIVRNGAEVRLRIEVDDSGIDVIDRRIRRRVRFDEIESISWAAPLSLGRRFIPGLIVTDRAGRSYRIPAVIEHGDRLVERLVQNSRRSDLASWAEVLGLASKMGRAGLVVSVGYGVVVAVLAAALLFRFR